VFRSIVHVGFFRSFFVTDHRAFVSLARLIAVLTPSTCDPGSLAQLFACFPVIRVACSTRVRAENNFKEAALVEIYRLRGEQGCGEIHYGAGETVRTAIRHIPSENYVFVLEHYPLGIAFYYLFDTFRNGSSGQSSPWSGDGSEQIRSGSLLADVATPSVGIVVSSLRYLYVSARGLVLKAIRPGIFSEEFHGSAAVRFFSSAMNAPLGAKRHRPNRRLQLHRTEKIFHDLILIRRIFIQMTARK
jgi:hypothetical protein